MRSITIPAVIVSITAVAVIWVAGFYFSGGATNLGRPVTTLLVLVPLALAVAAGLYMRLRLGVIELIGLSSAMLLTGWALLATTWSLQPYQGQLLAAIYASYVAMLLVGMMLGRSRLAVRATMWLLGLSALVTAAYLMPGLANESLASYQGSRMIGPLGYFNAHAATLLLPVPLLLALSTCRDVPIVARALSLAPIPVMVGIAMLAQSRGGFLAFGVALIVWLIITPRRLRALVALGIAGVGVIVTVPTMQDAWAATAPNAAGEQIQPFISMMGVAAGIVFVLAVAWAALDSRIYVPRGPLIALRTSVATAIVAAIVVASVTFGSQGADWITTQRDALTGKSELQQEVKGASRFATLGTGSARDRVKMWKVARRGFNEAPIKGQGARSWELYNYINRDENNTRYVKQPHSTPFEIASEFGAVGLILSLLIVGAVAFKLVRILFSSGSSSSRIMAAGIGSSLAFWFAHSMVEWFQFIPSITLQAALLGGIVLAAPWRVTSRNSRVLQWSSIGVAAGAAAVIVVISFPAWRAERRYELAESAFQRGAYYEGRQLLDSAVAVTPSDPRQIRRRLSRLQYPDDRKLALQDISTLRKIDGNNWFSFLAIGRAYEAMGDSKKARQAYSMIERLNPIEDSLVNSFFAVDPQSTPASAQVPADASIPEN